MKAQIKSTLVALWSSAFSCEPIDGCLRSLTSSSFAVSGTCWPIGENRDDQAVGGRQSRSRSSAGLRSSYRARSSGPRCSARRFESVAGSGLAVVRYPFSDQRLGLPDHERPGLPATSSARRSTRVGSIVSSCASSAAVTSSSRKPALRGSKVMRATSFPCIAWRRGLSSTSCQTYRASADRSVRCPRGAITQVRSGTTAVNGACRIEGRNPGAEACRAASESRRRRPRP